MIEVKQYRRTPPFHIYTQVSAMTAAYVTDLSLVVVPPSNPMWPVHSFALATEVEVYMDRMGSIGPGRTELIVAEDDSNPGRVIGFLMHLLVHGAPEATGVAYMAVADGQRRKGVARKMIDHLLAEYPHVELSCTIEKVPVYEKMGFQIVGVRDNQVRMNTREYTADGMIGTIDVTPIFNSQEALLIRHQQLQKYGRKAMEEASKAIKRNYDQGVRKAEQFLAQRLGSAVGQ